jgi:hypothetical protein
VLIYRPVQVAPAASDLDVGLIEEPPITGRMAGGSSGVGELRRERLHPPVDRHVIHLDAALGKQLLHVAVGQAITQVPAHRNRDHLTRKPIASRGARRDVRPDHCASLACKAWHRPTQQSRLDRFTRLVALVLAV